MARFTLITFVTVLGACQMALANCPAGYPNEILCDDFDTYCDSGGHPGDTKCPSDGTAVRNDGFLWETWLRWPPPAGDAGTDMRVEDNQQYLASPPYGGRHPCQGLAYIGQVTIRDWVNSEPIGSSEEGQIRNMGWLLENTFGPGYAGVVGTDANPLVLTFLLNGGTSDKIAQNAGYVELSLGEDKAQTDYIIHESCKTYCSPGINKSGFKIVCAQGNPDGEMPEGCPPADTAPIHASIAVGVLSMMDTDPCHCNELRHGSTNQHLVIYDGQIWWSLRNDTPIPTTGDIVAKEGSPLPPPGDIATPGDFVLNGGCSTIGAKSHNLITLTIKSNTFDVKLVTYQTSCSTGYQYWVSSIMEDIPRAYKYIDADTTGAFNAIRIGVSASCELASNEDWETCTLLTDPRMTPQTFCPTAGVNIYDDFTLYGGEGQTLKGSCCDPDNGVCTDGLYPEECQLPLIFNGPNTSCSTELCCVDPFADTDGDDDVDQADFGIWQACFAGPDKPYPAGCECLDRHPAIPDGDVDEDDFVNFVHCWSGPSISADPACDD